MTSHVETPLLGDSSKSRKDAGGDSAVKDNKSDKNNSISADESVRKRVLKKVGLTSTAFIGPAFPPAKSNIEDTLSEFYKELGEIATDVCKPEKQDKNCVQSSVPRKTFTSRHMPDSNPDTMYRPSETDGFQRGSGQQSWPHWYQNEPYNQRRQRPGNDLKAGGATHTPNQRLYPQPLNRPPDPTFHRPPFPHPPLRNPRNLPPHGNPNWSRPSMMNQYHDHFPPFPRFPPPMNECSPHRFDRDERGYGHDAQVDNGRWSRNAQEEWDHLGEEYNGHERFDSGSELWERQHHCRSPNNTHAQHPSLVLILMRGLPGSGKSTMARYIFSVISKLVCFYSLCMWKYNLCCLSLSQGAALHGSQWVNTEHRWLLCSWWRLLLRARPSWNGTWMEPEQRCF